MAAPFQDCVFLLGDSLTQCQDVEGSLQSRMSDAYNRKLDVINRGFGGYTSEWIRAILPRILAKKGETGAKIRLVTLWLGANDAVVPPNDRAMTAERFKENLNFILTQLSNTSESPYAVSETPPAIVLITPGPPIIDMLPIEKQPTRTVETMCSFKDAALEVGKQWESIAVLDLWKIMSEAAPGDALREYYIDVLHLNSKGYNLLWTHLSHLITTTFNGRGLNFTDEVDLPMTLPGTVGFKPQNLASYRAGRA